MKTVDFDAGEGLTRAEDCKCNRCGRQAVAFWPAIDPDVPALPWCRACLAKAQAETMAELMRISRKNNKRKK